MRPLKAFRSKSGLPSKVDIHIAQPWVRSVPESAAKTMRAKVRKIRKVRNPARAPDQIMVCCPQKRH